MLYFRCNSSLQNVLVQSWLWCIFYSRHLCTPPLSLPKTKLWSSFVFGDWMGNSGSSCDSDDEMFVEYKVIRYPHLLEQILHSPFYSLRACCFTSSTSVEIQSCVQGMMYGTKHCKRTIVLLHSIPFKSFSIWAIFGVFVIINIT